MKFIMCILFLPIFLVKLVVAVVVCFALYVLLAISMAFGADGENTKELVQTISEWAKSYPPADL